MSFPRASFSLVSLSILAASLSPLAALRAQQRVSPLEFRVVEAPNLASRPFGSHSTNGWRYLQVHDDLRGSKLTIRELGFRRDGAQVLRYSKYECTVSMSMSTAKTSSQTIDAFFDKNHGANKKSVVINRVIKFPATRGGRLVGPWDYRIKLDTPYAFDGTSGGLCWEARVSFFRGLISTVNFDAAWSVSSNPPMAIVPFGAGCVHSEQTRAAVLGASSAMNWNTGVGTINLSGNYQARSALTIGTIGFSRTSLGGIPLPFEIPGSSAAYSGSCRFYVSMDLLFGASTNNAGWSNSSIPIPVDPKFAGLRIYAQMMSVDPSSSAAIQFITTNGVEFQFVPPYKVAPVSSVYASNTLISKGNVQKTYGMVSAIF